MVMMGCMTETCVICGRVDDQLAAVGDKRLQLVKPLAAVQMSSYLVGIIDSTGRYGRSR